MSSWRTAAIGVPRAAWVPGVGLAADQTVLLRVEQDEPHGPAGRVKSGVQRSDRVGGDEHGGGPACVVVGARCGVQRRAVAGLAGGGGGEGGGGENDAVQ